MAAPLIELRHVCKAFGKNRVLDDVSMIMEEGEMTTIIGKSGVGKSVLLKHLIGLLHPDAGEVLVRGQPIAQMSRDELRAVKREFSYMFQNLALFDSLDVFDNIALPLRERTDMDAKEVRHTVMSQLERMELREAARSYPSQLSGGMKKRVALARALVTAPTVVLFDEPTTGLDPIRKNTVHSLISRYRDEAGFTAVMVSHEIPDVFYISQKIAMLHDGRVVFEGPPGAIDRDPNPVVRSFVRGLDGLKTDLSGMQSKTQMLLEYSSRYANRPEAAGAGVVLVFRLAGLHRVEDLLGDVVTQQILRNFARLVRDRLGPEDVGSCQCRSNQVVAVLEGRGRQDADRFIEAVSRDLGAEALMPDGNYPRIVCDIEAAAVDFDDPGNLPAKVREAETAMTKVGEFSTQ